MVENDKFLVTNIRQYLNSDHPKLGALLRICSIQEAEATRSICGRSLAWRTRWTGSVKRSKRR